MALHHLTKKAAVEKYSPLLSEGKSREQILLSVSEDPKNFSADEVNEIVNAIIGEPRSNANEEPKSKPETQTETLGLSGFNYDPSEKGFIGDQYKDYEALVNKLRLTNQFDFEVYKAKPVKVERYPGLPGTPIDIVGIKVEGRPIFTTRVEARHALEMNRQLQNTNRYYLLKK
jgi:hypothetical protein